MADEAKKPDSGYSDDAIPESIFGVMATISFMLYSSFLVTTLIFPVKTQDAVGSTLTVLPAFCGLLVFACTHLVAVRMKFRRSPKSEGGRIALSTALTVPLLTAMAASAFDLQASLLMQAAAWTLWGLGQALFFPLVGSLQARVDRNEGNRKISLASVGSAIMCISLFGALALFAPDPLRSFLPGVYFVVSLVFFFAAAHGRQDGSAGGGA